MSFFNPEGVEEVGGFEVIPPGWYRVQVKECSIKKTKAGTGTLVALKLQVIEGPHGKRILFTNFNLTNPNPEAERIGKGQFKRFLKAIGITTALQSAEETQQKVTGKLLFVNVGIGKHYQSGEPQNEVKDYADQPKAPIAEMTPAQKAQITSDIPF